MLSAKQEKTRLEQEKTHILMLLASEGHTTVDKKPNWIQRLLRIQTS